MDIQHGLKITSKSNALREAAHLEEFLCLCVCEIRSISKEFPAYLWALLEIAGGKRKRSLIPGKLSMALNEH